MAFLTRFSPISMGVLYCTRKVHHGKQAEDESLDKTGEKPQKHHGHRRKIEPRQKEQYPKDQFLAKHVSEKTDRQAQDP